MVLETIIARYGLLALLLGAGIEGEAVVVTGGVLAHKGLIPVLPAALCAAAGSFLVDQFWFHAGRRLRENRLVRRLRGRAAYARAAAALERHPTGFILAFRFVYGTRTVGPIAIGASSVPLARFVPLNLAAAAVWGPAFTFLGFWLGKDLLPALARIAHFSLLALAAAVLLLVVAISLRRILRSGAVDRRGAAPLASEQETDELL